MVKEMVQSHGRFFGCRHRSPLLFTLSSECLIPVWAHMEPPASAPGPEVGRRALPRDLPMAQATLHSRDAGISGSSLK